MSLFTIPNPDAQGELEHQEWIGRKEARLARVTLDCGHKNGGEVYYHLGCDRLTCSTACADADHDCSAFGGVKVSTGIEERAAEVELVGAPAAGNDGYAIGLDGRCASDDRSAPTCRGCGRPPQTRPVQRDGLCCFCLAAPRTDRVADAFRAEVELQGLSSYSIDGLGGEVERDTTYETSRAWDSTPFPAHWLAWFSTVASVPPPGPCNECGGEPAVTGFRMCRACLRAAQTGPPHADADLQPAPAGRREPDWCVTHETRHGRFGWRRRCVRETNEPCDVCPECRDVHDIATHRPYWAAILDRVLAPVDRPWWRPWQRRRSR